MSDKILVAGFGGQGVMFVGKIITYAGMLDDREVCWIPSYGPEMRGGTANCTVIISEEEIHSPVVEMADAGIVLNQPSYEKFMPLIKPGGTMVLNSSIVKPDNCRKDITIISVPASEMANEIGNSNLANMVCLGALLPKLTTVTPLSVEKAIAAVVGNKKPAMLELNNAAIQKGLSM